VTTERHSLKFRLAVEPLVLERAAGVQRLSRYSSHRAAQLGRQIRFGLDP
jgi:hypothetical protein